LDTTFKVKGQGHQAALFTAVLARQAAASVGVRTCWPWETVAVCSASQSASVPTEEERALYRGATHLQLVISSFSNGDSYAQQMALLAAVVVAHLLQGGNSDVTIIPVWCVSFNSRCSHAYRLTYSLLKTFGQHFPTIVSDTATDETSTETPPNSES